MTWGPEAHEPFFCAARAYLFSAGWVTQEVKFEPDVHWKQDPIRQRQYLVIQMLLDNVLAVRKDGVFVAVRYPPADNFRAEH
eukprot:2463257-Amphidinium_carterae.1